MNEPSQDEDGNWRRRPRHIPSDEYFEAIVMHLAIRHMRSPVRLVARAALPADLLETLGPWPTQAEIDATEKRVYELERIDVERD